MIATVADEPEQTVVSMREDIVTENVEQFRLLIDEVLRRRPGLPVVLDLTDIDYLCSAGVGVIAGAHRNLRAGRAELIVRNPGERVSRLFMVTRLDTVLRIVGGSRVRHPVK